MNIITNIDEASKKLEALKPIINHNLWQDLDLVIRAAKALPLNLKFKIGDKVRLTKTVKMTKDNYGWHGYEKELQQGKTGTIANISAYDPRVYYSFMPEGVNSTFGFGEEWLEKIVSEEELAAALKSLVEIIKK